MDFKKLNSKAADPLDVFPELAEWPSWGLPLEVYLVFLRQQLKPLPDMPDGLEPEQVQEWRETQEASREPLYDFVPEPGPVRAYMLYTFARSSPHIRLGYGDKRREKALEAAGVPKRERDQDGWRLFTGFTDSFAWKMLDELLRDTQSRTYTAWLSDSMALDYLERDLRTPPFAIDPEKSPAYFEKVIKNSAAKPAFLERIAAYERALFPEDEQVITNATSAALAPAATFAGGDAERWAQNVK